MEEDFLCEEDALRMAESSEYIIVDGMIECSNSLCTDSCLMRQNAMLKEQLKAMVFACSEFIHSIENRKDDENPYLSKMAQLLDMCDHISKKE